MILKIFPNLTKSMILGPLLEAHKGPLAADFWVVRKGRDETKQFSP